MRCREVRGTKHRGNHLPPVIISHLSAALEEAPDGLGGRHVQLTDREAEKSPDVTPVPRKYQPSLSALAAHEHPPLSACQVQQIQKHHHSEDAGAPSSRRMMRLMSCQDS